MEKVIINSYEEFEKLVGQQIGVSDYVELSQERINLFADATLDHQWIHVDTERAKVDSPYHSTIAHGYLTLSMLPYLWNQIIQVNNLKMMINYGMDKMKFGQAVLSGQSIRLVTTLHSLTNLRGVAKAEIKFAIEIKDQPKKHLKELLCSFIISINGKLLKKQILSPEMIEIRLKS
jgi:Acyl dehydratase